jgi:hypothetical protein
LTLSLHQKAIVALVLSGLAATSCSSSGHKKLHAAMVPTAKLSSPTPSPPPTYTADQVNAALLTPSEVAQKMTSTPAGYVTFPSGSVATCSLAPYQLQPSVATNNRLLRDPNDQTKFATYLEIVARYDTSADAATSFSALKVKLKACPSTQHIPEKRVSGQTSLAAHDDVWKLSEDASGIWTHLHAFEVETEPPGYTKRNVFNYIYDYTQRGNIIVTSVYLERTNPGESADPAIKNGAEILAKQLQKFGP